MHSKKQTMCPTGYYQSANGPMVTHALGHMMYDIYIYIYMYVYIYIYIYTHIYIHPFLILTPHLFVVSLHFKKKNCPYPLPSIYICHPHPPSPIHIHITHS